MHVSIKNYNEQNTHSLESVSCEMTRDTRQEQDTAAWCTLGTHRLQFEQRTGFTEPRPLRFLPLLRLFFVIFDVCGDKSGLLSMYSTKANLLLSVYCTAQSVKINTSTIASRHII